MNGTNNADPTAREQLTKPDGEQAHAVPTLLPVGRGRAKAAALVFARAAQVLLLLVATARRRTRFGVDIGQRRHPRCFENWRATRPYGRGQFQQVQRSARQVSQSTGNGT